jgi:hypothetical protein
MLTEVRQVSDAVRRFVLMMEPASTSETSVTFYQTTRHNSPDDSYSSYSPPRKLWNLANLREFNPVISFTHIFYILGASVYPSRIVWHLKLIFNVHYSLLQSAPHPPLISFWFNNLIKSGKELKHCFPPKRTTIRVILHGHVSTCMHQLQAIIVVYLGRQVRHFRT